MECGRKVNSSCVINKLQDFKRGLGGGGRGGREGSRWGGSLLCKTLTAMIKMFLTQTRGGSGGGGGGGGHVPPPPPPLSDDSLNIHECFLRTACDYNRTKQCLGTRLAIALIYVLTRGGSGGGGTRGT